MSLYYVASTYWGNKETQYNILQRVDGHQGIMLIKEDVASGTANIEMARGIMFSERVNSTFLPYYGKNMGRLFNERYFIKNMEIQGIEYIPVTEEQYNKIKQNLNLDSNKDSIPVNLLSVNGATNCKNYVESIIDDVVFADNKHSLVNIPGRNERMTSFELTEDSKKIFNENMKLIEQYYNLRKKHKDVFIEHPELTEGARISSIPSSVKVDAYLKDLDEYLSELNRINKTSLTRYNYNLSHPEIQCFDGLQIDVGSIKVSDEMKHKTISNWSTDEKKEYFTTEFKRIFIGCIYEEKIKEIVNNVIDNNVDVNEVLSSLDSLSKEQFEDMRSRLKALAVTVKKSSVNCNEKSIFKSFLALIEKIIDSIATKIAEVVGSHEYNRVEEQTDELESELISHRGLTPG